MAQGINNQRNAARSRKRRASSRRRIEIFAIFIALVVAFVLGFFLRGQNAFLTVIGFPLSANGTPTIASGDLTAAKKDIYNSVSSRLGEVEDVLAKDSLDTYNLDEATVKTLTAFAESSNDPYLRYYSPGRYGSLLNSKDEGYTGVGVLFSEYNGQAYVVDVFEGSPAQLEGVQEGDFVVAIDGDNSQVWSRAEVTALLSQESGSSVIITWRRPETLEATGGKEFTTTLPCQEFKEVNVTSSYDEAKAVGYIKVKQFTHNCASLVQEAIDSLTKQGAKALVLDVRDNPGGYLSQAVSMSSLFMTGGTVVEVKTVDGTSAKAATGQPATAAPVVLLVNKNTAAAAEVVAAALKESQRATLVGATTMGKGSVQVLYELKFGGALRYTAAYYLTPEGHSIDKVGVTPEVVVGAGDGDSTSDADAQKDYAIALAGSMGESNRN